MYQLPTPRRAVRGAVPGRLNVIGGSLANDDGADRRPQETTYDAQDITVLEGLEAVRKRPGMYIGSTGPRGLHHLVYEVVDNSVDEALAGHCDAVSVTIHPDNSVTVVDDGRGIPVAIMEKEQRPAVEVVLTVLHAGGKFGDGGGYKVSGGLHGVGVSVVNALSERLDVEVRRDGFTWTQTYERGKPLDDLKKGAPTTETGTTITFLPDADIFETLDFDFTTIEERMRETAFLTAGLRITIVDERGDRPPGRVRIRGRDRRLRRLPQREQGADPQEGRVLHGGERRGSARGRDAVERELPGVGVLIREQHQHARGRLPSERLPLSADQRAQQVRARQGRAPREGREPHRRGCARGTDGGDLGEAERPPVRGPDQDQARQPGDAGVRPLDRQRAADGVPGGEPTGRSAP